MDANHVRREWAHRSGEFSPEYYAYYGPNESSESLLAALDRFADRDATVLELGSSAGRHLSHLLEHGYENLVGVEINGDAFDVMSKSYPELARQGTFHHGAIEDVIGSFEDDRFEVVYSVETLQHLHPDVGWVFDEVARVASNLLVTIEIERAADRGRGAEPGITYVDDDVPLYHRDWNRIFTGLGLEEIESRSVGRDTFRVFRSSTS